MQRDTGLLNSFLFHAGGFRFCHANNEEPLGLIARNRHGQSCFQKDSFGSGSKLNRTHSLQDDRSYNSTNLVISMS